MWLPGQGQGQAQQWKPGAPPCPALAPGGEEAAPLLPLRGRTRSPPLSLCLPESRRLSLESPPEAAMTTSDGPQREGKTSCWPSPGACGLRAPWLSTGLPSRVRTGQGCWTPRAQPQLPCQVQVSTLTPWAPTATLRWAGKSRTASVRHKAGRRPSAAEDLALRRQRQGSDLRPHGLLCPQPPSPASCLRRRTGVSGEVRLVLVCFFLKII